MAEPKTDKAAKSAKAEKANAKAAGGADAKAPKGKGRPSQNEVAASGRPKSAPADYDFPQTRGAVRGHKELLGSEFAEIDLDGKRLLAAKVPSIEVGSQLVRLVSQSVHGTRPELVCFTPKVTRGVVFDLEATGPAAKATVGKKRR